MLADLSDPVTVEVRTKTVAVVQRGLACLQHLAMDPELLDEEFQSSFECDDHDAVKSTGFDLQPLVSPALEEELL